MSNARTFGIGVAAMIGFVIGGYLGIFLILAIFGFTEPEGFEAWTIGLGSIFALGAALLASPHRSSTWRGMTLAAASIGLVGIAVVSAVDGGPEMALGVGAFLAAALATVARLSISDRASEEREFEDSRRRVPT